jgi:hypothetical protein
MIYGYFKGYGFPYNRVYIWEPNSRLKMSADEQYRANRKMNPDFKAIKVSKPEYLAKIA